MRSAWIGRNEPLANLIAPTPTWASTARSRCCRQNRGTPASQRRLEPETTLSAEGVIQNVVFVLFGKNVGLLPRLSGDPDRGPAREA